MDKKAYEHMVGLVLEKRAAQSLYGGVIPSLSLPEIQYEPVIPRPGYRDPIPNTPHKNPAFQPSGPLPKSQPSGNLPLPPQPQTIPYRNQPVIEPLNKINDSTINRGMKSEVPRMQLPPTMIPHGIMNMKRSMNRYNPQINKDLN